MVNIALLVSTIIFRERLGVPFLIKVLVILDLFVLFESILVLLYFESYESLVFFFFFLGCFLVIYSCIVVIFIFGFPEEYDFQHKSDIYDSELQQNLSEDEIEKFLEKKVSIVSREIEKNLGVDQGEFFSYLQDLRKISLTK